MADTPTPIAHLIDPWDLESINVLGPTIQFVTEPAGESASCTMRGTIPPGVSIPLHNHDDPETFLAVSGEVQALSYSGDDFTWLAVRPGEIFHVSGGAKHAFRNQRDEPAVMILISTSNLGRFFQEVGAPVLAGASPVRPPAEEVQRFLDTAARYGYWNATPEENARVGIGLPPA